MIFTVSRLLLGIGVKAFIHQTDGRDAILKAYLNIAATKDSIKFLDNKLTYF